MAELKTRAECGNDGEAISHETTSKVSNKATGRYREVAGEKLQGTYRDFSRVPPSESFSPPATLCGAAWMKIKGESLPVKLNDILSNPNFHDIITWLPHGRSWRVENFKRFQKEVMPHYFNTRNFSSFIRLVNSWGFRRISAGMDRNSYYHELFLRGLPHLQRSMHRNSPNKKKGKVAETEEPNFYSISEAHPLPCTGTTAVPKHQQQEKKGILDRQACVGVSQMTTVRVGQIHGSATFQRIDLNQCINERPESTAFKNLKLSEPDRFQKHFLSGTGRMCCEVTPLKPLHITTGSVPVDVRPHLVLSLADAQRSLPEINRTTEVHRCSMNFLPTSLKCESEAPWIVHQNSRKCRKSGSSSGGKSESGEICGLKRHDEFYEAEGSSHYTYPHASVDASQSFYPRTIYTTLALLQNRQSTLQSSVEGLHMGVS